MQAEEGMLDVLQKMADEEEDSVCKSRASNVLQNVRRMDTEGAMVTTVSMPGVRPSTLVDRPPLA